MADWQNHWHRHYYMRYWVSMGDEVTALGPPNARLLLPLFRYDPLVYRPAAETPYEHQEVVLDQLPESGLDFYAYLDLDSYMVTYDLVKERDHFLLESSCIPGGAPLDLKCEIVAPPEPHWREHQLDGYWGNGLGALALPIALHLGPQAIAQIAAAFEKSGIGSLTFHLSYGYHIVPTYSFSRDGKLYAFPGNEQVIVRRLEQFLNVRPSAARPVRVLIASDLHVSDRADTLESRYRAENPNYCNFNKQAKRLADKAVELWKNGEIDYVVLNGDLVDFARRDSLAAHVDVHPSYDLKDDPEPYGYGEYFYTLSTLVAEDVSFISGPDGNPDTENRARAREVVERLGDSLVCGETNWEEFRTVFGELLACVPTFLTPGNHDYLVFGYDLMGMSKTKFDQFVAEVLPNHVGLWRIAGALVSLATLGLVSPDTNPPPYESTGYFGPTGLTAGQANDYDETRVLQSNYRPILAVLQDPSALIHAPALQGADSFVISQSGGTVRLAFFDTGPNWNIIQNSSPWLVGFPLRDRHRRNIALDLLERWRDDPSYATDTLVGFAHAPLLSHLDKPHSGSIWEDYGIFAFYNSDTPDEQARITGWGVYGDPPSFNNEPQYGIFVHGWLDFLLLATPRIDQGLHHHGTNLPDIDMQGTIKSRERAMLMFGGHTHFRHTYSLTRIVSLVNPAQPALGSLRCMHYLRGNKLLDDLNSTGSVSAAKSWWTGRTLVVHTGCVGPIPPLGYSSDYSPQQPSDPPLVDPLTNQGFFVMTLKAGIVTSLVWHPMPYNG